jgi:sugar phosphate isomerase/epimerase
MTDKKIPIAIQLYSLRDVVPGDVPGTLRKVADMGYDGVECAGYYDLDAVTFRKMLDDCGLRCAGSHVGLDALEGDALKETIEVSLTLGSKRLIVPSANLDNVTEVIERLNAAHALVAEEGMSLGFHNHTEEFELVDGVTKFDMIFSGTPSDFLVQLDIGWAVCAGQDVPAILRKYSDRLETVHVKEFDKDDKSAVVGEGSVEWASVFDVLEKETAIEWYVVEQEEFEVGPLESAKGCIDNIRKLGR